MAQTLAQKLKLKENSSVFPLNAPETYAQTLKEALPSLRFADRPDGCDQIHCFAASLADLRRDLPGVLGLLPAGGILWLFFPKGSSGVKTDLNRDSVWREAQSLEKLRFLVLVSFDEIWSAFALRPATDADVAAKKRAPDSGDREINRYADSAAKTLRLPEDLETALLSAPEAKKIFDTLSFSHRREYVEWIVTAKRPETRAARIEGTLERLVRGQKNPRNT